MKINVFLIFFLLLSATAYALNEDLIYTAEQIKTSLEISSKIELKSSSSSSSITFAAANLTFIPLQKENQQVLSIDYEPQPAEEGNGYSLFRWENPALGEYGFNLSSELLTTINRKEIKQKADFPIKNLAVEYGQYTKPTDNIDSNDPEIVSIASQLAGGEDDQYIVVNKLVSWIKENINYSLDTSTAEVSQPASWVIKNRYGVCDEITSLFAAMARSLGIPVRYVSGMAYTNYGDLNNWGPHAWAEVYYPNVGWVAYDITYDEFGYVDATHIALKESLDSNEASTSYEWKGMNVELEPQKMNITVKLLDKIGKAQQQVDINVNAYKPEISFGSYDVLEAEIQNLQDYYISEDISLARVTEMEIFGSLDQQIVLKPREAKKIYWLIKVSSDLDRRFIYTLPITVYSSRNVTGSTEITSTAKSKAYNTEEMQQYINEKAQEEIKRYSKNISLNCSANEKVLIEQIFEINCTVINEGNVFMKGLNVCLAEQCEQFDLGITKSRQINYKVEAKILGNNDFTIKASNNDVSKTVHVVTTVYDQPNLEIANIDYPPKLKFGEQLKIKFLLNKTSLSNPTGVKISVIKGNNVNSWEYGELKADQNFTIDFDTKQMSKKNEIKIKAEYSDEQGNKLTKEKDIIVEVEAVKFFDKIKLWLNGLTGIFG